MPQMGESVAEGTIVRWIKKVGDAIERDEPLFEISTDKVDAEIPSPVAGVLTEIRVKEGETVPVNSVVALIGDAASAAAFAPTTSPSASAGQAAPAAPAVAPTAAPSAPARQAPPVAPLAPVAPVLRPWSLAEARELRLSPLVRKIAKEHHVDVRNIAGSGSGGRVTKADILAYLDAGAPAFAAMAPASASARQAPAVAPASASARQAPAVAPTAASAGQAPTAAAVAPVSPISLDGPGIDRVPMTVMRRRIAEHMVMSRRTSAHVHSVFEVDFTKVDEIRKAKKAEYEKAGGKITYMSFITKAVADALKAVPVVNASVEGSDILYRKDVNIGVAVALDWGLIVPVIKGADKKNLLEISRAIVDVAARARDKKLSPDDVQGGTFTITNPGVFGALFGMPIINQPQVAILGVGAVEKRPVVINDAVTIRLRAYLTLGYDHRIIDGAVADEFMSHLKKTIENFDQAQA